MARLLSRTSHGYGESTDPTGPPRGQRRRALPAEQFSLREAEFLREDGSVGRRTYHTPTSGVGSTAWFRVTARPATPSATRWLVRPDAATGQQKAPATVRALTHQIPIGLPPT